MSLIIVTGIENVPDRSSRTGWSQRAYARKVSSIDKIEDKESIWSGELRWTDGDPEGRFDAGWMGPHGLILSDRQHELALGAARADLRRMEAAIKLAEKGRTSQEWDDVAQEWVTVTTPASDEEVAAGLEAMEAIDGVRSWLESATTRTVDGTEAAEKLAALRDQRKQAKEAEAAGDANAIAELPYKIQDLIAILDGHKDSYVGVNVQGDLYWKKGSSRSESSGRAGLQPYMAILGPKAAAFDMSALDDDEERERFRKFWSE
ncbi:MAG: hypothetical protein WC096_08115 [Sphaerochaetaceae bacterium]